VRNNFRPRKFEDFEIVNEDELVVGHVRVKPNKLLWSPPDSKVWYGVPLNEFARYAKRKGQPQKK
jgi:hypothetical protein